MAGTRLGPTRLSCTSSLWLRLSQVDIASAQSCTVSPSPATDCASSQSNYYLRLLPPPPPPDRPPPLRCAPLNRPPPSPCCAPLNRPPPSPCCALPKRPPTS